MDKMLPRQAICSWVVWTKEHLQPVSMYSHLCWWGVEAPPCSGRRTGGLPASASPGGALVQRPSGCAHLSFISNLLVADEKLSLSCLMTGPWVNPSTTSLCNVPDVGGCSWHWLPNSCDGGQQWKTLSFHPGTKGPKQLWLCPQAKNGCG